MSEKYLEAFRNRFSNSRFRVAENTRPRHHNLDLLASHMRFDLVGSPCHLEEWFFFTTLDSVQSDQVVAFSGDCWSHAIIDRHPMTGFASFLFSLKKRLLMGVRAMAQMVHPNEAAGIVLCTYSVVMVPKVSPEVVDWIKSRLPERHSQGFEIQLILDTSSGQLYHYEKVPWLGNAFYSEFKKVIKKRLVV